MAILTLSASRAGRRMEDDGRHSLPKVVPIEQYRGIVLLPRRSPGRVPQLRSAGAKPLDAA